MASNMALAFTEMRQHIAPSTLRPAFRPRVRIRHRHNLRCNQDRSDTDSCQPDALRND